MGSMISTVANAHNVKWAIGISFCFLFMALISGESLLQSILNYSLVSEDLITGNISFNKSLRTNINIHLIMRKGGKERSIGVFPSMDGGKLESNLADLFTAELKEEIIAQNDSREMLHIVVREVVNIS